MKVAHLSEPAEERVIFRDGLGVRERRETNAGEVLEWFHLDPAFGGVEQPLRERVVRLAKLQHVKFARIFGLEPAGKGRGPILVSSHVAGTRLAEILEMAGHGLLTFDPGVGLQVTREVLGGLAVLHDSRNVAHGALGPERVVLTATGRVVMVEHVLAHALDRLQRPRHQLWREWRIPTPPATGPARLDMQTDLAQAGVLALAALLGRPIEENEYPHRLRGLLPLAQDRLSRSPAAGIAGDVVAWLERLAPVDSRRAFKTVREAQQALEALVSGGAVAMGVTPARVKGTVAAVASMTSASPAAPDVPAPAAAAPPTVVASTVATPAESDRVAADVEIDIEALLRLEAELEGGTSPVDPAVTFEPQPDSSVQVPTTRLAPTAGSESSLEALAQERLDLERQFAELVATVAPQDEAPVHLIPETPATSEPLVAPLVLWSSMPADDVVESAAPLPEATAPADGPPVLGPSDTVWPVPDDATGGVHATSMALVEPLSALVPEDIRPAAAVESVPAGWWTDALPWRSETLVAASQDASPVVESAWVDAPAAPELEAITESSSSAFVEHVDTASADAVDHSLEAMGASVVEGDDAIADVLATVLEPAESYLPDPVVTAHDRAADDEAAEWTGTDGLEPGVGEEFGYLSLAAVDARVAEIEMVAADAPAEDRLVAEITPVLLQHDVDVTPVATIGATDTADETPGSGEAEASAGEYRLFPDIEAVERPEVTESEPAEADAQAGQHWFDDDAPLLAGFDEVPVAQVPDAVAQDEAFLTADAGTPVDESQLVDEIAPVVLHADAEVTPVAAIDATGIADETSGGDEAAAPAGDGALYSDLSLVELEGVAASASLAEVDAPAGPHWFDDAPVLAGFDEVLSGPAPEVIAQYDALTAGANAPVDDAPLVADTAPLVSSDEMGVTPVAAVDTPGIGDETSGGEEAAAPVGEDPLYSDLAPVALDDVAAAALAEADAPADQHWFDDAPVAAAFDEVPVAPAPEVIAQEEAALTADANAHVDEGRLAAEIAPVVLHDDVEVAPVAIDATRITDETPDREEAVAPAAGYRVFGDVEPAAMQEAADVEEPSAEALFCSHHVDSAPVTAAVALLAREATEDTTPDWRHAFLSSTPVEGLVGEETPTNVDAESAARSWPEPPLAHEARGVSIESVPPAAEAPGVADACAPEPGAAPEPLPQPGPEERVQPLAATAPDLVPTLVVVDDDPDRDAWDGLPSEATAVQAEQEYAADMAAVVIASSAQVEPEAAEDDVAVASTPSSVQTTSATRRKRKRSRRKKGVQGDVMVMASATIADVVPADVVPAVAVAAPPIPAPPIPTTPAPEPPMPAQAAGDDALSALTPSTSSLLEREVPLWTPPADLGIRRTAALASPPEQAAQPDASSLTGERTPGLVVPAAVPPPLSVASTVEVVRPVTAIIAPLVHEASAAFEQEVRAVGMPDLEDLAPRPTRPAISSIADGIGSTPGSASRVASFDPRVTVTAQVPARRKNWRRLVAASVLIALFQGAAFAAWWWVQPGARGTLVVQTSKVGVEVLLDDKVVGRTPFREEVAPGRHRLGLRQGSTVREMPVEISVGVVTTQSIDWPSLTGGRGNLQVTSSPTGARIFVNGKARGEAPLLLEDLPAGDQVLTVRGDAGSVTVTATVVADETTPLEVKIFAGWVLVDAPVEVNLLLNGREKIGSSMDGQLLLPPGSHRLQAVNDALGIRQWFTVTVEPGAVRRVPLRVAPGTLALQEEAEIFVDGTSAGTTPGTVSIAPGTHEIAIRPASGPERRQAMTVRSGQRIEF